MILLHVGQSPTSRVGLLLMIVTRLKLSERPFNASELASRASKRDRHQYQNDGNRQSDRYFRVDTEATRLQSFGHVADESGDVVGDGRYRQPFDRLLEP